MGSPGVQSLVPAPSVQSGRRTSSGNSSPTSDRIREVFPTWAARVGTGGEQYSQEHGGGHGDPIGLPAALPPTFAQQQDAHVAPHGRRPQQHPKPSLPARNVPNRPNSNPNPSPLLQPAQAPALPVFSPALIQTSGPAHAASASG